MTGFTPYLAKADTGSILCTILPLLGPSLRVREQNNT